MFLLLSFWTCSHPWAYFSSAVCSGTWLRCYYSSFSLLLKQITSEFYWEVVYITWSIRDITWICRITLNCMIDVRWGSVKSTLAVCIHFVIRIFAESHLYRCTAKLWCVSCVHVIHRMFFDRTYIQVYHRNENVSSITTHRLLYVDCDLVMQTYIS